jgi:hypothetical protein
MTGASDCSLLTRSTFSRRRSSRSKHLKGHCTQPFANICVNVALCFIRSSVL